jgi:hypothetical protein
MLHQATKITQTKINSDDQIFKRSGFIIKRQTLRLYGIEKGPEI